MDARTRRFQNQQRAKAAQILTAMERGASLYLSFSKNGNAFVLSNGTRVPSEVAMVVINDARIVAESAGLFPAAPQSWKYEEPRSF
jgi:hypothetical protein